MVATKLRLQSIEASTLVGQTLDGINPAAIGLNGEGKTGAHRAAVQMYGTCSADAMLAADVGACGAELMTQEIGAGALLGPAKHDLRHVFV